MTLTLITPATGQADELLDDAKVFCGIEDDSRDGLVLVLLEAALDAAGLHIGRPLGESDWRLSLDGFPACDTIALDPTPLIDIAAVNYVDEAGAGQTFDPGSYVLDLVSTPGRVVLADGASWPATATVPNAVSIDFTAGYSSAGVPLPGSVKLAVLGMVNQWFEDRAPGEIPAGVLRLLAPYRRIII